MLNILAPVPSFHNTFQHPSINKTETLTPQLLSLKENENVSNLQCTSRLFISLCKAGPALGMFDLFGRTGPPILEGAAFLNAKKFPYKLHGQFEQL